LECLEALRWFEFVFDEAISCSIFAAARKRLGHVPRRYPTSAQGIRECYKYIEITTGLAESGGGVISTDEFACSLTILQKAYAICRAQLKGKPESGP
jgi:hypothetical protein